MSDTESLYESEEDRIYNRASDDSEDDDDDDSIFAQARKPPPAKKARKSYQDEEPKRPNLCDYMINRHYRPKWQLRDGIRELVQNTLDGAFVYANEKLDIESPRQLKIGEPTIRKNKPPKKIGLPFGYEVTFILSVREPKTKATSSQKWTDDKKAVACIRCLYGTYDDFDKKDIQKAYLEGSLLYSFEAENRASDFDIKKILTLGDSTKTWSANQAGKFGEGLKVGAVSILRKDFILEIQGNSERCRFDFRKSRMTKRFTLHAKIGKSTKRYEKFPELVGAKITRSTKRYVSWSDTMVAQKTNLRGVSERFRHENFRVLLPNRNEGTLMGKTTKGELLLAEQERAKVYCKSIFVEKKAHLLFGYDLPDLDLPMERNHVHHEEMLERSGELLADILFESELDEDSKKKIKDEIMKMLDAEHSRNFVEAQVLYDDDGEYDADKRLAKEIAKYFEELHGKEAFPCEESQKKEVEERLPGRKARVVSETFLHILKRGGYHSLAEAEDALYSKDNETTKQINKSPLNVIITKALLRIANAGIDGISREKIVFLQEDKLPKTKSSCKEKDGVFYVNDRLLGGKDVDDESYMIAYHLIHSQGNDDALTAFIRDRNDAVELEFEVTASASGQNAIDIFLSQALHCRTDVDIVVKEFNGSAVGPLVVDGDNTISVCRSGSDLQGQENCDDSPKPDPVASSDINHSSDRLQPEFVASSVTNPTRRYPIGTKVRNFFRYYGWFDGVVVESENNDLYRVKYEDDDEEDYPEEKLEVLANLARVSVGSQIKVFMPEEQSWRAAIVVQIQSHRRNAFCVAWEGAQHESLFLNLIDQQFAIMEDKTDQENSVDKDVMDVAPTEDGAAGISTPANPVAGKDNVTADVELFRQSCAQQRRFRVSGLEPGTRYTIEAIDSNLDLVVDPHSGESCRIVCRTDLVFKDPSEITAHCFKNHQIVNASGGKNTQFGVQLWDGEDGRFVTKWQDGEDSILLDANDETQVQLVCRPNDKMAKTKDLVVSRIGHFDFSLPKRLDCPPAASVAEMWTAKQGYFLSVSYPVKLPPQSKLVLYEKENQQRGPVIERNLGQSGFEYTLDFQSSETAPLVAYLAVPIGQAVAQSRANVFLVSDGIDVVTIEKPVVSEDETKKQAQSDDLSSHSASQTIIGGFDDGVDDEDDDDDDDALAGFGAASVDNDDDSDNEDDNDSGESEDEDDDSEYGDDLDESELDKVFQYDADGSEYSPEDNIDDPSADVSDDTCVFEEKTFTTGETYYSADDDKFYTIVRLFPHLKPPKAECEVDMYLRDTFVGKAADGLFGSDCTVRCDSAQLYTVALDKLTTLCYVRPDSFMILERTKGKHEFALYVKNKAAPLKLKEEELYVYDFFAGIGGMSLGYKNAGLLVRGLVEIDQLAASHLKQIHSDAKVYDGDINACLDNVKAKKAGYPGKADFAVGHFSAPCQAASSANGNGGKNDEKNNELTYRCSDVAALECSSPVLVFENTTGMLRDAKSGTFKEMLVRLLYHGYQIRVCVLKPSDYGDAQDRKRMFMFAAKKGYELPRSPLPTHGDDPSNPDLKPFVTAEEAIGDLVGVPPTDDQEPSIVCLDNGTITYNHQVVPERPSDDKSNRLNPNKPAPTTISSTRHYHYSLDRLVTQREDLRFHSFPDDFQLFMPAGRGMEAIANAVPVRLATAVGKVVKKALME